MISHTIKRWLLTITVLVAAAVLFLYPTNYFVKKPGEAYGASNYISVENKDEDDTGEFRFTTVAVMTATPFSYALGFILPHQEVVAREEIFQQEEDPDEYKTRQLELMDHSKFNAISVAFKKANLPYEVRFKGLNVLNVLKDSAADSKLKTGDVIVEFAGEVIQNTEQFVQLIDEKTKGDEVDIVVERNKELVTETVKLKEIPNADGKVGLGITYTENQSIQTDPPVKMDTEDIGGPSAGLMFTLEILNQLLEEDITKGYIIAGTGTMNADGTVGRIGGIEKKVVAAHKAGAQYFLAPDDVIPSKAYKKNPMLKTNYEEAVAAAKKIDTDMEIVAVQTIDDAIDFLQKLEPK